MRNPCVSIGGVAWCRPNSIRRLCEILPLQVPTDRYCPPLARCGGRSVEAWTAVLWTLPLPNDAESMRFYRWGGVVPPEFDPVTLRNFALAGTDRSLLSTIGPLRRSTCRSMDSCSMDAPTPKRCGIHAFLSVGWRGAARIRSGDFAKFCPCRYRPIAIVHHWPAAAVDR